MLVQLCIEWLDCRIHSTLLSRLSSRHLCNVTRPNVPVLVDVFNPFVALLLILLIDHFLEGLSNPVEQIVLLHFWDWNGLI